MQARLPYNVFSLFIALLLIAGCASRQTWIMPSAPYVTHISELGNEQAARNYLSRLKHLWAIEADYARSNGKSPLEEIIVTAQKQEVSITHNQEPGVDEGDIVKRAGDYLIVLRKGELYSVKLGLNDSSHMQLRGHQRIISPMNNTHVWYDELLIYRDSVIVLGYSYETTASLLAFYRLEPSGSLTYQKTYSIDSSDYYDTDNYAIRLIGDQLVFYQPMRLSLSQNSTDFQKSLDELTRPLQARRFSDGRAPVIVQLSGSRRWFAPVEHADFPVVHTIVRCSLTTPELVCETTSIIGARGAEFYVSPNAFYLWSSDEAQALDFSTINDEDYRQLLRHGALEQWTRRRMAFLYRLDHHTGKLGVIQVQGFPENQFALAERDQRLLAIATVSKDDIDISDNLAAGVYGLQIPVADFQAELRAAQPSAYHWISSGEEMTTSRFLNDYAVIAQTVEGAGRRTRTDVFAWQWPSGRVFSWLSRYPIHALHPVSNALIALGQTDKGRTLALQVYAMERGPRLTDVLTFNDTYLMESRSHGFNSSDVQGHSIFGIPLLHLMPDQLDTFTDQEVFYPTNIGFFELTPLHQVHDVGEIEGSERQKSEKPCEVSCIDWYGAARPFFIDDRLYALMDFELVRARLVRGKIEVEERLSLTGAE